MRRFAIVVVLFALGSETAPAQEPATGGFFFAYAPNDRAAFESGYRRHLDWHSAAGDSLSWFGWDVLVGARPDHFVDGVFGVPFGALDVRVDPAGDQADAAVNVLAHAVADARELVALRRDLSSATPLEDGTPALFTEVVWYEVIPGRVEAFEAMLSALSRQASAGALHPYTVYERVAGAEPGFVLMVWRNRLSSFDEHERSPRRTLDRILDGSVVARTSASIIRSSRSEVWRYRRDLTYLGSGREMR
jgi:hypothetical protein